MSKKVEFNLQRLLITSLIVLSIGGVLIAAITFGFNKNTKTVRPDDTKDDIPVANTEDTNPCQENYYLDTATNLCTESVLRFNKKILDPSVTSKLNDLNPDLNTESAAAVTAAGVPSLVTFNNLVYLTTRTSTNDIITTYTANGTDWSEWTQDGRTPGNISNVVFGGKLFQAVRGMTGNTIYTRYTIDGLNWSAWNADGRTPGNISMAEFSGRLYQGVRGNSADNTIYTRYTVDGITWSGWVGNGRTPGDVSMALFGNRLVQGVRGNTGNIIYTRYTFDGSTWSGWTADGRTPGNVTMTTFRNKLFQAVQGNSDNTLYTRYSSDANTWNAWIGSGTTTTNVSMINVNDVVGGPIIVQATKNEQNRLATRYSYDGINEWSPWLSDQTVTLASEVVQTSLRGTIFQAVRLTDNTIYVRFAN